MLLSTFVSNIELIQIANRVRHREENVPNMLWAEWLEKFLYPAVIVQFAMNVTQTSYKGQQSHVNILVKVTNDFAVFALTLSHDT